jgi:hypothetical protein
MHNPRVFFVVLALSVGTSSCVFRKQPRAFLPPPPRPAAPAPKQPDLPSPPTVDADASSQVSDPSTTIVNLPEIDAPPAPRPRRGVVTAAPKPAATAPPQTTEAPPRLGKIFTPDQLKEYNRALDESLDRVRKALVVVAGKNLNAEQGEIANRIRTFQRQAEQARELDLVTAVSLARRADLLAQDLLGRLP